MERTQTTQTGVPDLLTLSEVADILRTPVATLRYWRHQGIGPHSFRVGRRVMYGLGDLDRWITEQRDAAASHRRS